MTWEDVIEYEKRDSFEEGKKVGINNFISACHKMDKSDEDIITLLMEEFSLTEEEAIDKVTNS